MLVGITGTPSSGRHTALEYFKSQGLEEIEYSENAWGPIISRWQEHFVVMIPTQPEPHITKWPWFVHLNLDAPDTLRRSRMHSNAPLEDSDNLVTRLSNAKKAHMNLINDFSTIEEFRAALEQLNVLDTERVRPSWDRYFMTLAELASQRSNCMKRRVGCVLVQENRIIATGYNGTPRGVKNCNEGGCPRCNGGSRGGVSLSTCLCLHAEENALLEAGRLRVMNSTLYCNTCPCLTCSIKIVQTGVAEVVYSQDYSMDKESAEVLKNGGVKLRKYKIDLPGV